MPDLKDWETAEIQLAKGRSKDRKKLANNTYLERRDEDTIAVILHATDIVTYHRDGRIVLSSGTWRTMTTKDRINGFAPVVLYSVKGVWRVAAPPPFSETYWDTVHTTSVRFADGITFKDGQPVEGTYPDATAEERLTEARRARDALIKAYVAKIPPYAKTWAETLAATGSLSTAGDCFYCLGIVTTMDGSESDDIGHLWKHLRESYIFPSLVLNAFKHRKYNNPQVVFQMVIGGIARGVDSSEKEIKSIVTKYLRDVLDPEKQEQNSAPANEYALKAANEVLAKPDDFGYFGSDERLWKSSAPTWTRTRDSENVDLVNFDIVLEALKAEFPDLWKGDDEDGTIGGDENPGEAIYIFGAGHWAVGHIDQIVVPVLKDGRRKVTTENLHPAFLRVLEFRSAVEAYPSLDDERVAALTQAEEEKDIAEYLDRYDAPYGLTVADVSGYYAAADEDYPYYLDEDDLQKIAGAVWASDLAPRQRESLLS